MFTNRALGHPLHLRLESGHLAIEESIQSAIYGKVSNFESQSRESAESTEPLAPNGFSGLIVTNEAATVQPGLRCQAEDDAAIVQPGQAMPGGVEVVYHRDQHLLAAERVQADYQRSGV